MAIYYCPFLQYCACLLYFKIGGPALAEQIVVVPTDLVSVILQGLELADADGDGSAPLFGVDRLGGAG